MKTFRERALVVVRRIPKGKVMTYQEVAKAAGNSRAARGVGSMMRVNYDPSVPCHRVIKSDGTLGSYNRAGGTNTKMRILKREGVRIVSGKVVRKP